MYPLWIKLEYKDLGKPMGYTGSVTSRAGLIEVLRRLDIQVLDVKCFSINNELQPQSVIKQLFEELFKT